MEMFGTTIKRGRYISDKLHQFCQNLFSSILFFFSSGSMYNEHSASEMNAKCEKNYFQFSLVVAVAVVAADAMLAKCTIILSIFFGDESRSSQSHEYLNVLCESLFCCILFAGGRRVEVVYKLSIN